MYIVKYSERVHMARMHELASASPPYLYLYDHMEADTICSKLILTLKCRKINIACRWLKTMTEILKPMPLHSHGNFVFGVCKL